MSKLISKRFLLAVFVIVVVAAIGFVVGNNATDGRLGVQLEFAFQDYLNPYGKVGTVKVESLPTMKLFLNPEGKVVTYRIMETGIWEPTETHYTKQLVRKGDTYVDIGANVGYYTVLASHLVGEEGRVIAFEPDPVSFRILEKNVLLNGLTNVTLEQKAVSNEKGVLQLFIAGDNKGDHRIYQTEEGRPAIDIEAVKLDDYFADDSGSVDFVKIDTQGAEGIILEGMAGVIKDNDDIVMAIEYWPSGLDGLGYKAADLVNNLRSHDMLFYEIAQGSEHEILDLTYKDKSFLLDSFSVENELFTNIMVVKGFEEMSKLSDADAEKFQATVWEKHGRTVAKSAN
jgi:FkbM family methyltransferase